MKVLTLVTLVSKFLFKIIPEIINQYKLYKKDMAYKKTVDKIKDNLRAVKAAGGREKLKALKGLER